MFDRRFRIDARVAAGGFGAIYRATHVKSGHQLALKVLHAKLTGDPGVVARFRREGAALTRLRDPHTITAYELGEAPDGTLYIVMELLRGESLYERFRARGPLPWQRVLAIARAVCSSLIEAHALGIIHRDLKPTNIHLEPHGPDDDFVKVLDFGIAKIVHESEIDSTDLTHAGQMIGTLDYMSPEQMVGGLCAPASDIYTLGVVMYEMITGRKPFDDANSAAAALAAVLTTTPTRLSVLAVVPADVDRIVMRCLERHHTDRYQSAAALAAALDEVLSSGEEAVTTVDLNHARGAIATIAGMRMPAKLPMMPIRPAATDPASPVPGPPSPLLTPAVAATGAEPVDPSLLVPPAVNRSDPRPRRLTPTPSPIEHAPSLHPGPPVPGQTPSTTRSTPSLPKLIQDAAPDGDAPDTTLIGHLPMTRAPAPSAALAAASVQLATEAPGVHIPAPAALAAAHFAAAADPGSAEFAALTDGALGSVRPTPVSTQIPAVMVASISTQGPPPMLSLIPPRRQTGVSQIEPPAPNRNLRASYPTIHRLPPSPMRPSSVFDERSSGTGAVFDMSRVVRREAFLRRVAIAVGIAVVFAVALLIAARW